MNRMLMTAVATLALLMSSTMLWGHDERLHGANAVTGQVVAAGADGMELKTRTETVKVKFSSKTKFEHDKKVVDRSHVKVGDRAGIVGNKLPTGEWMANEVILGLPAPNPSGGAKSATKKEAEHKR
ncbi:MAG: hypothetical protein HY235_30710 [Acidobacteria bacterium]|nr:hypothetical protein [Acidobacteriota bacterium]